MPFHSRLPDMRNKLKCSSGHGVETRECMGSGAEQKARAAWSPAIGNFFELRIADWRLQIAN
jgi:hypothetical protein